MYVCVYNTRYSIEDVFAQERERKREREREREKAGERRREQPQKGRVPSVL